MKKICFLLIFGLFLSGCGTAAKQSEFWQHDTVYKNWNHFLFSWYRYKGPACKKDLGKSQKEQWWGIQIQCVPEK
ncbi:MAG: hypothetical protein JRI41_01255 [Deltaproteobacteria bacterium]|nr:hypothetical protein [Deltaproteobacteria bacterium]